ncbi:hypothetical protein CC2G_004845 [Coprinopsis cinerea AmutBmut pab1-1]|nr:hypothetical protein CC2G_004845 [Coprinopsis cinerea AmutBmut pab1-1]
MHLDWAPSSNSNICCHLGTNCGTGRPPETTPLLPSAPYTYSFPSNAPYTPSFDTLNTAIDDHEATGSPSETSTGTAGESGDGGLSTSDKIAIGLGVPSAVAACMGIWLFLKSRGRRTS